MSMYYNCCNAFCTMHSPPLSLFCVTYLNNFSSLNEIYVICHSVIHACLTFCSMVTNVYSRKQKEKEKNKDNSTHINLNSITYIIRIASITDKHTN